MAKAESRLRQRIKQALEADGWSVITQYGSAYSPNVLDLTVVVACLEVKTSEGSLRAGQRNTIRRLRKAGIPAGIVRSVEDARQGMARIKQGAYRVADNNEIDMSFLNSLLAGSAVAEPEPPRQEPDAAPAATLTELMGMQGTYEEFTPAPADPEPEPVPASTLEQAQSIVDNFRSGLKTPGQTRTAMGEGLADVLSQLPSVPSGGVLERIVGHLAHIDELLSGFVSGFQGPVPAATEKPVRQTRRGRPPKVETGAVVLEDPDAELPF